MCICLFMLYPWNPEFKASAMTVAMAYAEAVAFVTVLFITEITSTLRHHQALKHYLHKIVQAIFSLCVLAH